MLFAEFVEIKPDDDGCQFGGIGSFNFMFKLDKQAFLQGSGGDAGGIEGLNHFQHIKDFVRGGFYGLVKGQVVR